jgi:hypothetical protein
MGENLPVWEVNTDFYLRTLYAQIPWLSSWALF